MEGGSKQDGEIRSLIRALWETNDNMMELLSEGYTYKDTLEDQMFGLEKPLEEWGIEDLNELYLSAPVKRMVWQTLSIVKELEKTIGAPPKRIFVEMAKEEGEKGKRTISRKQKLMDLYKAIGKEANEWRKEVEEKEEGYFKPRKLYLYYLQMGKCMYTGKTIDLSELLSSNSKYDIDHIYPRHFIKDDSLENNLVLVNKQDNARKSDNYPLEESIRGQQSTYWKFLRDKGFISAEKYHRLTRNTTFTEEEKAAFISRQIVETRQGTKAITQILKQAFPDVEIVFSKASEVSEFRKKYDLYKVRSVNNYHHAHDAYLNIVVGNAYFTKFTKNPIHFIREAVRHPEKENYKYHMDKIFDWDVCRNGEVAWKASKGEDVGTIKQVRQVLKKNSPLVTRRCAEYHGGITRKATIWSAETAKKNPYAYIPVKMDDERMQDVTKYGGLTAVATSGYSLVEYTVKGERIRSLEAIPVYLGRIKDIDESILTVYFEKQLQIENKKKKVENIHICRKFIPAGALIKYNGFYYYLGGKTKESIWVKNAVELCLSNNDMYYIKKIEKAHQNKYFEERDKSGNIIITEDRNIELFKLLKEKYCLSIYKNQIGVVGRLVKNAEAMFQELSREKQVEVLLQIIINIQRSEPVDLHLIGGAMESSKNKINKKINNVNEVVLITQSVTGLYQAEINLLTV